MNRLVNSPVTCWAIWGSRRRIVDFEGGNLEVPRIAHQLEVNIFAHLCNFFIWRELPVTLAVEVQLVNDLEKARAAENLLGDVLDPVLQIFIDIRHDVVFWHRGLLHQDQRARLIAARQNPAGSPDH